MLYMKTEAKMESGNICRNFWLCDYIAADSERYNWCTGQWETVESKTSQRYFIDNLQGLSAGDRVNLYINSMGGSVKEALGIYNVLQRCPAEVYAYIDGFAASAASVIAMAAKTVIMPRNTAMMIHNARLGAYGTSEELRKAADDLEVMNTAAIQSYAMHAGDKLPEEQLQRMLDAETWLTAEDCMKYGLADAYAEEDANITVIASQFASASAKAGEEDARMFRNIPDFLSAYITPAQPTPQQAIVDNQGQDPVHHSCVYALLKNITNLEETK